NTCTEVNNLLISPTTVDPTTVEPLTLLQDNEATSIVSETDTKPPNTVASNRSPPREVSLAASVDLERDLEEYEKEQQINAQYVEEFAMLTSEKDNLLLLHKSLRTQLEAMKRQQGRPLSHCEEFHSLVLSTLSYYTEP
ncbi:unnamed protein product, partial [Porites evermanni]